MNTNKQFQATILFNGDSSVGVSPYAYTMELDANLIEIFEDCKEYRKELRTKIQALYTEIDNDQRCKVIFSDETIDQSLTIKQTIMNTLEQIVSTHPCPIIRAKIMENVDKTQHYNDISEAIGRGFFFHETKEGGDFWDNVCMNFYATYDQLKHLDLSYVAEPIPPTPKWLPIDRDNLPDDKVAAMNINDNPNNVYSGVFELVDDKVGLLIGKNICYPFTHYIPLTDLLNLPIAE